MKGVTADPDSSPSAPPDSVSTNRRAVPPGSPLRQEVTKVTACLLLDKAIDLARPLRALS